MDASEPVAGITGVTGNGPRQQNPSSPRKRSGSGDKAQEDGKRTPAAQAAPTAAPAPTQVKPDIDAELIEALDRLRATGELQPVEEELSRHIRGARYYQEESRHALPILPEDLSAPAARTPDRPQADPPAPESE